MNLRAVISLSLTALLVSSCTVQRNRQDGEPGGAGDAYDQGDAGDSGDSGDNGGDFVTDSCPLDVVLRVADAPCSCDGVQVRADWIVGECYCRSNGSGFGCPAPCDIPGTPGCVGPEEALCYADSASVWVLPDICGSTNPGISQASCATLCSADAPCPPSHDCVTAFIDVCQGTACAAACPGTAQICVAGGAGGCRNTGDCAGSMESCWPPEGPAVCGICHGADGCTSDADCGGPPMICDMNGIPTTCGGCGGGPFCSAGCSVDGDCLTGQSCGADNRCYAAACGVDSDCPINFACNGSTCARRGCSVDGDCDTGYCVEGGCYRSIGYCSPPVP